MLNILVAIIAGELGAILFLMVVAVALEIVNNVQIRKANAQMPLVLSGLAEKKKESENGNGDGSGAYL